MDIEGDSCLIPPNSFALAETVEYFEIPRDILGICVGKSTYARCGIIVNVTPLEPEWRGKITIEISNTTPLPAKIYANEGIAQILFLRADAVCEISYGDKRGKYQDQKGLTLPFVVGGPPPRVRRNLAISCVQSLTFRVHSSTEQRSAAPPRRRGPASQRPTRVGVSFFRPETPSMQITRRYTVEGKDPFGAFAFVPRTSRIANPDGKVVFEMKDLLAPEPGRRWPWTSWPRNTSARPACPREPSAWPEEGVPEWLQRSVPAAGDPRTGQETDARQVFRRLAGCWTYWGWKGGYFSSEADARAFYDETCHMLAAQMAAPNSPQWFNTGLHWAYGIDGPAQGHYRVDPQTRRGGAVDIGL